MLQLARPDAAQLGLSLDSLLNDKSNVSIVRRMLSNYFHFLWSFFLGFLEQQGARDARSNLLPRDARSRSSSFMSYDQAKPCKYPSRSRDSVL
jgi:hypothetical protein